MEDMWLGKNSHISPHNLKSNVAKIAPQFSGYGQQDSQEFMNFLLDGIHEDLNSISEKPYKEINEKGIEESDEDAAQRFWQFHKMRNDSIIVDLFHGQYKSTILCPNCKRVSTTYDPFTTVSLPIPKLYSTDIFFIPKSNILKNVKLTIHVSPLSLFQDINRSISKVLKRSVNGVSMIVEENKLIQVVDHLDNILELGQKGYIFFQEVDDLTLTNSSIIPLVILHDNESLTFPRMIAIKEAKQNKENKENDENDEILVKQEVYKFVRRYIVFNNELNTLVKESGLKTYEELIEEVKKTNDFSQFEQTLNKEFELINNNQNTYSIELNSYIAKLKKSYELFVSDAESSKSISLDEKLGLKELKNPRIILNILDKEIFTETTSKSLFTCVSIAEKGNERKKYKDIALEDCLESFRQIEKLDANNKWYCTVCKDHFQAFKKLEIYFAPKVMILHLKRFEYQSAGHYRTYSQKTNDDIEFDVEGKLDMKPFVIINNGKSVKYELYAVSNHFGSCGGGHYTATAKNDGVWYDFNDSSARKTNYNRLSSSNYLLLFKRVDE